MSPPLAAVVLAADLVPWWFAAGFWIALVALAVVVVRDVHRAGGVRAVLAAIRRALEASDGPGSDTDAGDEGDADDT